MSLKARDLTRRCQNWRLELWVLVLLHSFLSPGWFAAADVAGFDPDYVIDSWQTPEGLPENSATAMVQTRDGYLWFGTFNGLVRFDGVRFTVFDPPNAPGLPGSEVVNLHLDRRDRLWVSTTRGLAYRDGESWVGFGAAEGWRGNFVRTFSEASDGALLLTTFDGHLLEFRGNRLEELPLPPGQDGSGYIGVVDEDGKWWVIHHRFVGRWTGKRWEEMVALGADIAGDPTAVGGGRARDGGVWVLGGGLLQKFRSGMRVSSVPFSKARLGFWGFSEDSRSNLWICSFNQGLFRVKPSGEITNWATQSGLAHSSTRFVFEDREANLWIGTSGAGLRRFKARRFSTLPPSADSAADEVKSVFPIGKADLLAGSWGKGVFRWSSGRREFLTSDAYVHSTLQDRKGRIWVGAQAVNGLFEVLPGGGRREIPRDQLNGSGNVTVLFEDSLGRLWAGHDRGLSVSQDGSSFQTYGQGAGIRAEVRAIAEDTQGGLWVTDYLAVYRIRPDGLTAIRWPDGKEVQEVACFKPEVDGSMWMGSRDHGLLLWKDNQLRQVTTFPEVVESGAVGIHGIVEDDHGYFWLASNRGILRAARTALLAAANGRGSAPLAIQLFDRGDGLPSVECPAGQQPNCGKDGDGRLWFATLKGLASVEPGRLLLNTNPPPVLIEGFRVETRDSQMLSLRTDGRVRIAVPANAREVAIFFSALTYTAPEKVHLRYRIRGVHDDWVDLGARRSIYFYPPAPGSYRVEVKACNNDQVWNQTAATLDFAVKPRFWQTLWFRTFATLGCLGAIWGAVAAQHRNRLRIAEERLLQEQKVTNERTRAAALLQNSSDVVTLLDSEGYVIYVSPSVSRVCGAAPNQILGKHVGELVHPRDREGVCRLLEAVVVGARSTVQFPSRLRHGEGRWIGTESLVSNLLSQPGVEGILVTTRDISDRLRGDAEKKALEAKLMQAQKLEAVGQLAGGVAHDFNNILAAMMIRLGLLQGEAGLTKEGGEMVSELTADAKRAATLTRKLLLFSRRSLLEPKVLDLADLVTNLLRMLRRVIGEDIRLQFDCSRVLPSVEADPGMLEQVIMNLVVNARDAMPEGGTLSLTLDSLTRDQGATIEGWTVRPGTYVCISVRDSGCGMDAATRKRIFEPFFTTKGPGKGTGLGLATVHGIVMQHQGWIEVESGSNLGTTFRAYFPASGRDPDPGETTAGGETVGGFETILVVEDEPSVRKGVSQGLRQLGYRVLEAGNGPEALVIWRKHGNQIRLLLSDMIMPEGMTGLQLAESLVVESPDLRLVIVSGYHADLLHGDCSNFKGFRFLQKPCELQVLARAVREALDAG